MIRVGGASARNKNKAKVSPNNDEDGSGSPSGKLNNQSMSGNTSHHDESDGERSDSGKHDDESDGRPPETDMTSRDKWWLRLDDPSYSREGYWWSISILILITLSCTAFVVETIPAMCCGRYDHVWENIEVVCVAAFTIEYIARLIVCPVWACGDENSLFNWHVPTSRTEENGTDRAMRELFCRCRFFWKPLNLVDCAAILPFYVTAALPNSGAGGTQFLRVIRLARVFRLFKLSKYSEGMHLLSSTMVRSWRALGMLFFFMVISVIVFSSIMYFVERGMYFYCTPDAVLLGKCRAGEEAVRTEGLGLEECETWANGGDVETPGLRWMQCCYGEAWYAHPPSDLNGDGCADKSKYESIPATAWWCVVTMTTVGYGDVVPLTTEGKLVAMVTMLGGILILALPITVIGSNFNIEYEKSLEEKNNAIQLEGKSTKSVKSVHKPAALPPTALGDAATPITTIGATPHQLPKDNSSRETSDHLRGSFAKELGESQSALLEQVRMILQQQRDDVLKRAETMIHKHVEQIAKEVVAKSLSSHNGATRSPVESPPQTSAPPASGVETAAEPIQPP